MTGSIEKRIRKVVNWETNGESWVPVCFCNFFRSGYDYNRVTILGTINDRYS